MPEFKLMILMLLLIPAIISCGSPEQAGYHGYIYYAQGPYLGRFSLYDASLSIVANLGDKTIREVSKFGPDKLLIAETASVNRKEVRRISWIDVKTGQSEALYSGVLARYLGNTGIIIYDDGLKLYAVSLDLGSGADLVIDSHRLNQLSRMIEVFNDTVLFETGEGGQGVIRSYNAATGELKVLEALSAACDLRGAVWINTLEQLACKAQAARGPDPDYILVDLDGAVSGTLPLPEGKQFHALAYVADQGALILQERWHSILGKQENSAVWIHNIPSGENHRLAKNQNLGSSVVYTDY